MWLLFFGFLFGIVTGIAVAHFLLNPSTASKSDLANWTTRLESALQSDMQEGRREVGNVTAEMRKKFAGQ